MVMKPEPWAEALDHVVACGPSGTRRAAPRRPRPGRGAVHPGDGTATGRASRGWPSPAAATRASTSASTSTPPPGCRSRVVSLGDYVLNGGEVAVLAMVEAVGRLLPGVIGNAESLVEESHEDGLLEYPVYTKPRSLGRRRDAREVPPVLLSGDHGAIAAWRHEQRLARTAARRPDLLPARPRPSAPRRRSTCGSRPRPTRRSCSSSNAPAGCRRPGIGSLDRPAARRGRSTRSARGLGEWQTYAVRTASAEAAGRLVASVRGRVRPGDPAVWETGRLMVAPDLQGRGLGRRCSRSAEAAAPASVTTYWLNTGTRWRRRTSASTGVRATAGDPASRRSRGRSTSSSVGPADHSVCAGGAPVRGAGP